MTLTCLGRYRSDKTSAKMETLVKYNSFLELGNIEFEGFDNDDPEHRASINNLLKNWEKNCYLFDFNIIGNTDLKSPLFCLLSK